MDSTILTRENGQLGLVNDAERIIEFEFVRATENAALNVVPWLGRGEKEKADAAACDAIYGVFDLVDSGRIAGYIVSADTAISLQAQRPNAVAMNPATLTDPSPPEPRGPPSA